MERKSNRKAVTVARLLYLIVSIFAGSMISLLINNGDSNNVWIGVVIGCLIGGFFIFVESLSKDFTVRGFSTATFGLCIGLFCAWLLQAVNLPSLLVNALSFFDTKVGEKQLNLSAISQGFNFFMFSSLGYLGSVLALRTNQDDFAIVIPFIRFRQENIKGRPIVCSVDTLIDGRLPELIEAGFVNTHVILPPFVIDELQNLSNSSSSTQSLQGKRGLDTLEILRQSKEISVTSHKFDISHQNEDQDSQTILTCKQLSTRLLTCDENLTQIAKVQGIPVLNLKALGDAMKPQVEVGQRINIGIVKTGKEEHQGIGYLPDGTMIVVNNGIKLIGTVQDVTVISTIQTSAGVMVFTEIDNAA